MAGNYLANSMRRYFYSLVSRYLSLYIRPGDTAVEINPRAGHHGALPANMKYLFLHQPPGPDYEGGPALTNYDEVVKNKPDYILLNGNIHYERDIQRFLGDIQPLCTLSTRIVITYYSSLWKPFIDLATSLGLRSRAPEANWIAPGDIQNIANLAGYEPVLDESKIIIPFYIPVLSAALNRYLAPLPFFRSLCVFHILIARPIAKEWKSGLSVSVVVPARNEAGNIENAIRRLPAMGPDDELIFVEGHSTDDTWEKIKEMKAKYGANRSIVIARQTGKGKGDAVRMGFSLAAKDILMILDADLTVPPESLPLFYNAIVQNKGEFINGSRLVYPMDEKAMRFINMLGNKFFAMAFSFVLGQRFKDTLCGTKVLSREHYLKIAANRGYFGEFDPFGDFDLIFGAARLALKIVEVPIGYKERTYGETNIDRWRHGAILFKMLVYVGRKIKFI